MTEMAEPAMPANGTSYEAPKRSRRDKDPAAVEVRVRAERRRNWSTEDKLRIVRETLEPGAAAKGVADRHGISTGLLFTWRKQMLATAMAGFVPVDVVREVPRLEAPPAAAGPNPEGAPGTVEVALPSGTTVRISGRVDLGVLRAVLAELGGR